MKTAKRIGLLAIAVLALACTSVTSPDPGKKKEDTDGGGKRPGLVAGTDLGTGR